nr:MAG TPA: hypothetical protein [Caudoviricetes sp.]
MFLGINISLYLLSISTHFFIFVKGGGDVGNIKNRDTKFARLG